MHDAIITLTGDSNLEQEIQDRNYKAAAHELMSVIVALKGFDGLFKNNEEKIYNMKEMN